MHIDFSLISKVLGVLSSSKNSRAINVTSGIQTFHSLLKSLSMIKHHALGMFNILSYQQKVSLIATKASEIQLNIKSQKLICRLVSPVLLCKFYL